MSVKRLRPSSSDALSPSKRLVTDRLTSSKPALSPIQSASKASPSPSSHSMSRTGSTKENLFANPFSSSNAILEVEDASMEDVNMGEGTGMLLTRSKHPITQS
jgi:hypothetical protein